MSDLSDLANLDYVARINRAIDHVMKKLREPLRLEDVARAACFSPFHFHRIFKAMMGETLAAFVKRVRLERALYLMSHHDGVSLTRVALECGFASSSDFSRAFKSQYGVPPSVFDLEQYRRARRTAMQDELAPPEERHRLARLPTGENPDGFTIAIRDLPARSVAYIRVLRPYEPDHVPRANERLVAWAEERGLADGQWLGYQWEDPEIVPLERCRYDVGVEVPDGTPVGGEVCLVRFPPMQVAEIAMAGPIDLEVRALDWLYLTWLPSSGYAPDHHPAFEAWNGRPFAHGMEHFELRLQLPVVRASAP